MRWFTPAADVGDLVSVSTICIDRRLFCSYELACIITWDNAKRLANLDKHGLDFVDLELEFFLDSLVVPVREGRFKAIGPLRGRSMIVVVFASLGTEAVSVISMRPASKRERSLLDDRQSE